MDKKMKKQMDGWMDKKIRKKYGWLDGSKNVKKR